MIFLELLNPLGIDFTVYFEASYMFLHRLDPYRGIFSSTFPYNYPPPSFLFIWWLGLFPEKIAGPLWNFASLGAILLTIFLLIKLIKGRVEMKLYILFAFLFTLPFFPVKFNLGNGQINHFILLFCTLSLYFYEKKHKNLSAAFLAYAIGIKFAPIIFAFFFLIKKDYGQLFRVAACTALIFAASFLIVPLEQHLEYYFDVLPLSFTLGAKDWYYNQSLEGFLARAFHTPWMILGLTYLGTAIILLLTWLKGRKMPVWRLWATVSCLYLLIHPIALQHYFGFSIIPFIFLFLEFSKTGESKRVWLLFFLAYLLVATDIKNFNAVPKEFGFVLSHQFYGLLILWVLSLWKEKSWQILAVLWALAITLAYLSQLLCRANMCA